MYSFGVVGWQSHYSDFKHRLLLAFVSARMVYVLKLTGLRIGLPLTQLVPSLLDSFFKAQMI